MAFMEHNLQTQPNNSQPDKCYSNQYKLEKFHIVVFERCKVMLLLTLTKRCPTLFGHHLIKFYSANDFISISDVM